MYCPQCGQQQATEDMRFCSRCGFLLTGVSEVLAQGGEIGPFVQGQEIAPSPRKLGVKQGVLMMIFGVVIVPLLAILSDYSSLRLLDLLVPISAIICFCGGSMRILYALLFEQGAPTQAKDVQGYAPTPQPTQLYSQPRASALPPARSVPISDFTPRRGTTAELVQPQSVTENTTRLLDQEQPARNE